MRGDEPGPLFTNFDRAAKVNRLTGVSLYRIVRRLGEKNGFKVWPHGLRHTTIAISAINSPSRAAPSSRSLDEMAAGLPA
jgi:integrase